MRFTPDGICNMPPYVHRFIDPALFPGQIEHMVKAADTLRQHEVAADLLTICAVSGQLPRHEILGVSRVVTGLCTIIDQPFITPDKATAMILPKALALARQIGIGHSN